MAQGFKTGGRQKGTPNKNRIALRERLESSFPEYDPLIALTEIALDAANDLSVRIDCHKTIAAYIHPKLRAAESGITPHPESPLVIEIVNPYASVEQAG